MKMFEILALIPARGGSKGIPRKNVRPLASKPLIGHTIEHARQARSVDRVVVSTEISGDRAPSESALLHTLAHLQQSEGYEPDLVVFLQCTSPLMLPEDIDGTIQALLDENADSALAVTPFHYFLWRRDEHCDAVGINHDKRMRSLRQQREPQFLETGAVYVMRTEGFRKAKHRFFGKTALYMMPRDRCLEIDESVDLQIAEAMLRERSRKEKTALLPRPLEAVVFDFDGVFTDNRAIVTQNGSEGVCVSRSDGWGIGILKKLGIPMLVLTAEQNPVVGARCRKLGIPYIQGCRDKLSALKEWATEQGISLSGVVYLGNDVNDAECLQAVGCSVVVADAHPEVLLSAKITLDAHGGHGAIRELADAIKRRNEEV